MKKISLFALLTLAACSSNSDSQCPHAAKMPSVERAMCVLSATEGNQVRGMIQFSQVGDMVRVEADVFGLTPGKHGFHIHQLGDISAPDGTATAGHFNPDGHDHGGPDHDVRHAGDLGNLDADESGYAHLEWTDPLIQLGGAESIIGRSIIVHAGEDDLSSQPTGNAGARVAQGVIGIAK